MKKKAILIMAVVSLAMFFIINLTYAEINNTNYWSYENLSSSIPITLITIIVNTITILTSKKK